MSGPAMRPMPADFHLYAHETFPQLCERFRAGYHAVRRWLIESGHGLGDKTGKTKRKYAPADYATKFNGMSRRSIAKELGVSTDTLQRWDREQGITRPRHKPGRRPVVRPTLRVSIVPTYMTAPVDRPHLDMSYAGRAAEYLRRFGPVIRCDANGRFDIAGTHWRRGSTLLDAAQIVDRAVRNGFDADAWKRVAA